MVKRYALQYRPGGTYESPDGAYVLWEDSNHTICGLLTELAAEKTTNERLEASNAALTAENERLKAVTLERVIEGKRLTLDDATAINMLVEAQNAKDAPFLAQIAALRAALEGFFNAVCIAAPEWVIGRPDIADPCRAALASDATGDRETRPSDKPPTK